MAMTPISVLGWPATIAILWRRDSSLVAGGSRSVVVTLSAGRHGRGKGDGNRKNQEKRTHVLAP
jgi:hypothetical protein